MKLSFKIDYQTTWGEAILVSGSTPQFGQWDPNLAIPLKNQFPGEWQVTIETDADQLEYKYVLQNQKGNFIPEWGPNRKISFEGNECKEIRLRDFWRSSIDPGNALYSAAFQNVLLKRSSAKSKPKKNPASKILRLQLHTLPPKAEPID